MALLARLTALRNSPLAQRAARASLWSVAGYGTTTALRFISRIVLAKLLNDASPLGNVAVVITVLAGLELISDLGLGVNIVQHKQGEESRFLGTAYAIQLLRGGGLWVLASALAWPMAWIYHDPALIGLLTFGAFSTLFRSLANPRLWLDARAVKLASPTLVTMVSEIAGFGVTIVWAFMHASAWPLVAGTVATSAIYALGSHIARPSVKPAWDPGAVRQIITFGGWITLSTGTYFLGGRGETLMLKGSVPDVQFGCFALASMLTTTIVSALVQLATQVFFPLMAQWMREDPVQARKQFRRGKWAFAACGAAVSCGAILLGPPVVGLLHLNPSFKDVGWMLQALGVRAGLEAFAAPVGYVLLAAGASAYSAWANVVRLVILIAGLVLVAPTYGMEGAMWVLVGAPAVSYLALLPGLRRHMPGVMMLEAVTAAAFAGATLAAAGLWFLIQGRFG